jgi:hypothetical protein
MRRTGENRVAQLKLPPFFHQLFGAPRLIHSVVFEEKPVALLHDYCE